METESLLKTIMRKSLNDLNFLHYKKDTKEIMPEMTSTAIACVLLWVYGGNHRSRAGAGEEASCIVPPLESVNKAARPKGISVMSTEVD